MTPFTMGSQGKELPYWEVPLDVLEDRSLLTEWAMKSVAVAHKSKNRDFLEL